MNKVLGCRRGVSILLLAVAVVLAGTAGAQAAAFTITGVVTNGSGQGVATVDIDFVDLCSGDNVFLVNDKTASNGAFSIVVNQGTYDIHFTLPAGSSLAGTRIKDYVVAANASLGTIVLPAGRLVSGVVRNVSGTGIAGVDLKFVDVATGSRIWVGKDVTTSAGAYSVRVPPGTYDVEYRPPVNAAFATVRRPGLVVGATDIAGLVDVLPPGFRIDGAVRDFNANNVKNVDLDFFDNCTGEKIPTANDNTDVQGNYTTFVPAGTYSVHFKPPACRSLSTERVPGVTVNNNTGIGNTILRQAFPVTGRVLDNLGIPLAVGKLKFYDAVTGSRQGASNDNTDLAGNFSTLLPAGTFNVNVEPPSTHDLLVKRLSSVVIAGATSLGDVSLAAGEPFSGLAVGPGGGPVLNVNVNVVDSVTRASVILAHDSTALDGTFRVVVPPGTYDVQYAPPVCTGLAPDDQKSMTVAGPTALPTKSLVVGVHATGVVIDTATSNPVAGADLDFFPSGSALKDFTPGDQSDLTGMYNVFIKPGTYDIDYKPPAGSRFRPVRRSAVGIPVDIALPDTPLPSGWLLSGTVHRQSDGLPVPDVRIDVFPAGGMTSAWTPHNTTAVDGAYLFSVDAGTWDLQFVPPAGTGLAPIWRLGVSVNGDLSPGDTLLPSMTVPVVSGASPPTGSTAGGQSVLLSGSGFQPGATVRIGGIAAGGVSVLSGTSISLTTGAHPPGNVSIEVTNPGNMVGSLPSSYTYVEPSVPVRISASRSGNDIVITWSSTGQSVYTIFRSATPAGFSSTSIRGTTTGTSFTDVGGALIAGVQYYNVD